MTPFSVSKHLTRFLRFVTCLSLEQLSRPKPELRTETRKEVLPINLDGMNGLERHTGTRAINGRDTDKRVIIVTNVVTDLTSLLTCT